MKTQADQLLIGSHTSRASDSLWLRNMTSSILAHSDFAPAPRNWKAKIHCELRRGVCEPAPSQINENLIML